MEFFKKNWAYILLGVIIIGIIIFAWVKINNYKNENDSLRLELNSTGKLEKINDSLQAYTSFISEKFDSVLNSNNDLNEEIKRNKENPEIVTIFKTNTVIKEVPVETIINPESKDSSERIASVKNNWYDFMAKYRIKPPYSFYIDHILIYDDYEIVQVETENGRKKIYVKNHNPFVSINSLESFVDPMVITKNNFVEKNYWEWNLNTTYNFFNNNINISAGIYSPIGIGLSTSYEIFQNNKISNPSENIFYGIGILKKF